MKMSKEEKELIECINKSKYSQEKKDELINIVKINKTIMNTILSQLEVDIGNFTNLNNDLIKDSSLKEIIKKKDYLKKTCEDETFRKDEMKKQGILH